MNRPATSLWLLASCVLWLGGSGCGHPGPFVWAGAYGGARTVEREYLVHPGDVLLEDDRGEPEVL